VAQDSLWSSGSHAAVTSKESDSFNDQNFAEHKHRKESSVLRLSELSKLMHFFLWHAKGRVSKDMILPNKVGSALSKIAFLRAAPAVWSGRGQQATMKFAKLHQAAISFFYLWLRHHKA